MTTRTAAPAAPSIVPPPSHPMLLRAVIVASALALSACGAGGRDADSASTPARQDAAAQPLLAGVARAPFRVPVGTPLGGYLRPPVGGDYLPGLEGFAEGDPSDFFAELLDFLPTEQDHDGVPLAPLPDELRALTSPYATFSPPSRGYHDALVNKAVALFDGEDYLVFVKLDTIGMLDELVQAVADQVEARTGIALHDGLIMSATHTHGGPGAIGNHSLRYFWLAIDAYQPALFRALVPQIADVVVAALDDLQPARVGHGSAAEGFVHPLHGPRQLNGYRRPRLESYDLARNDAVRSRLGVLRVDRADGTPLAVLMNYPVHGIAFDVDNLFFSGDVPGAMERAVEQSFRTPVTAMLVQSVGGDVSPRGVDNSNKLQRIESFGALFAPQVMAIHAGISRFQSAPDIRSVSQRVILSRERLGYTGSEYPYPFGAAQCNVDLTVPFVGLVDTGERLPLCLPATPPDPLDLADNGVAENGAFVPQDTRLSAARIGDILITTQPGEPLVEYGVRLQDVAQAHGFAEEDVFIWGYAQDHIGYILAPEKADWDLGGTEGTTTFWGWKQGQRFLDASDELIAALASGSPGPLDEFEANYTYDALFDLVPQPPVIPALRPGRLVTEVDAEVQRFASTRFAWEGGDPVIDLPTVVLERRDSAETPWQPMLRPNGEPMADPFEVRLEYALTTGAHVWTADFEAPKDWPLGEYRFRVSGATGAGPYSLESSAFRVVPASTLLVSAPQPTATGFEVTLAYTPMPRNRRLIDALVRAEDPAPVRAGEVEFASSTRRIVAEQPQIEVRDERLVAVYAVNWPDADVPQVVSARDRFGNTAGLRGDSSP